MVSGILEVVLIDAGGIADTECFLGGMDPYVLIRYKDHERKSSVVPGAGSNPVWNEKFSFRVEYPAGTYDDDDQYKLILRIMDKDTFSADDFIGEAMIYLEDLMALGVEEGTSQSIHPRKYSIVGSNQTYNGGIRIGITFTPKAEDDETDDREEFGGWKQSDY